MHDDTKIRFLSILEKITDYLKVKYRPTLQTGLSQVFLGAGFYVILIRTWNSHKFIVSQANYKKIFHKYKENSQSNKKQGQWWKL